MTEREKKLYALWDKFNQRSIERWKHNDHLTLQERKCWHNVSALILDKPLIK